MSTFNFTNTIPQSGTDPTDDQPLLLENNGSITGLTAVDHVGYGVVGGGYHKKSTYVAGSAPGSSAGQAVQYGKASSGSTELFLQRDGIGTEIQLTRGGVLVAANGYTFLPGGIIFQWGFGSIGTGSPTPVEFNIPFVGACFNVQVTSRNHGNTPGIFDVNSVGLTTFTLYANVSGNFYYTAIGN